MARLATSILAGALEEVGLSRVDLAVILNCSEGRVRAKLDPENDGAPITLRDILKLRTRAPKLWSAVMVKLIEVDGEAT